MREKVTTRRRAAAIALGYAVLSATYIVLSSLWAGDNAPDPVSHTNTEIVKGLAFIAVTAVLLFVTMSHNFRRLVGIERELSAAATDAARAHYQANVAAVASALAHDMKNMVAAMRLNAEMLQTGTSAPDQRESLTDLQSAIERLDELSRELMHRATQSGQESWFSLEPLVRDCIRLVGLLRRRHRCQIEVRATESVETLADRRDLEQVVLNLLTNAVDATDEQGRIVVEIHAASEPVALSIEDDGPGVPAELRQRVFEPLFSTKSGHGSGVGLAVSLRLLDQYQGSVRLAEPQTGRGARFEVVLRTRPAEAEAA